MEKDDANKLNAYRIFSNLKQLCNDARLCNDMRIDLHVDNHKKRRKKQKIEEKSNKSLFIVEHLRDLVIATKDKIIVFSTSVKYLELLSADLDEINVKHCIIHGKIKNRDNIIEKFRGDIQICLLSLKCGAYGLNLQFANIAIFVDQWPNPFVKYQAIGREERIGQLKHMYVISVLADCDFENALLSCQRRKITNSQLFLESGSASRLSVDMNREELKELLMAS
jgi:transcription termination factor 2